jgi:hypothetical protein
MAWKKIVQRIGVGACPACQNPGFNYQEGADPHDVCPKCGWKGIVHELVIVPHSDAN